jgi:hypothetical protein
MFIEILRQTIMITSLVLVMMLIIEYINVISRGKWGENLKKSRFRQIVIASLLGLIPGCVGSFAVVSLYTHQVIGFGSLVANMIASSGDESFVMFSLFPEKALLLNVIVLVLAVIVGVILTYVVKVNIGNKEGNPHITIHPTEQEGQSLSIRQALKGLRTISFPRAVLLMGLLLFIFGIVTGQFEHGGFNIAHDGADSHAHEQAEWHWEELMFIGVSLVAVFLILIANEHFLEENIWEHIIKKHFLKIFLWTFGALLVIHLTMNSIDLEHWMKTNVYTLLVIAVLVGIIPESGPNLVFVIFYFQGAIPFSILLANSIVQDGHGALPLLAESKKSFFLMKLVNMIVAFVAGLSGLLLNI